MLQQYNDEKKLFNGSKTTFDIKSLSHDNACTFSHSRMDKVHSFRSSVPFSPVPDLQLHDQPVQIGLFHFKSIMPFTFNYNDLFIGHLIN
jgi:hypothetical protein